MHTTTVEGKTAVEVTDNGTADSTSLTLGL